MPRQLFDLKIQETAPPPRALNICFVIDNMGPGGTEHQLELLINHLNRSRIVPFLVVLDGTRLVARKILPNNCVCTQLGVNTLMRVRTIAAARKLRSFLKRNAIDVVVTFFPDSTRIAAPIAKSLGCTVFGTRRNVGHWMTSLDRRISRLWNRLFVDAIIANCQACKDAVVAQEGVNPMKVAVIPNGIDLSQFAHIPTWKPKPVQVPHKIGMVANLRPIKRPDLFIRAASLVLKNYPNTTFEIAGGGDFATYQTLIDELGLTDKVRLLGSISDIPSFLATLDVAVLTSEAEGMSNSLLEYMAAGRPIVATDVGGNGEVIANEVEGILVMQFDDVSVAHPIGRLLSDHSFARSLALAARGAVQRRFRPECVAECFSDVLRESLPVGRMS